MSSYRLAHLYDACHWHVMFMSQHEKEYFHITFESAIQLLFNKPSFRLRKIRKIIQDGYDYLC
jgi:hypothetical protein